MKSKRDKEKDRINKEALGKMADLVLDIIKLVFAGVIITGMMNLVVDKATMIWSATVLIVVMLGVWYVLFKRSKRKV